MTANQKFSRFIGIDVSKAKLDIYDAATGEFLTVENTAKAIEKYVSALSPDPELLIVVDLTGGYEALCVNTFYNRGFTVHRAEGRRVKAFMRSYGEHAKTDRIDAYALALFGRKLHETLRMYTPLPLNLKPVTERISDLKTMLLQEKNRSTAPSLPPDMKKEIVRHIAYLEKEIERLYQKCLDIIKNDPPLAEAFYKIIAIKGIAEKSAVLLLTTLPELGCANRRQIAAIAGVAPYAKDSGTLSGYRRIRHGRTTAKSALFIVTLVAIRHNAQIKEFYERLLKKGKSKMTAIIACARKLLIIVNATLKTC